MHNKRIHIFLGRMSPLHLGHQQVITKMISDCPGGIKNCLTFIGSCSSPISFRNLFTYADRRRWVSTIFPNLKVMGMPDTPYGDVGEWLKMLDDYLKCVFEERISVKFYGGDEQEVNFFTGKRQTVIIDRHVSKHIISATTIRKLLALDLDISKFVDNRIIDNVHVTFEKRFKQLLKI